MSVPWKRQKPVKKWQTEYKISHFKHVSETFHIKKQWLNIHLLTLHVTKIDSPPWKWQKCQNSLCTISYVMADMKYHVQLCISKNFMHTYIEIDNCILSQNTTGSCCYISVGKVRQKMLGNTANKCSEYVRMCPKCLESILWQYMSKATAKMLSLFKALIRTKGDYFKNQ